MKTLNENLTNALGSVIKKVLNSLGYNVAEVSIADKSTENFRNACFETSEIVTAPMMFSRIKAHGNITFRERDDDGDVKGLITLNLAYETFDGGSNGTEIGQINFHLYETRSQRCGYIRNIRFVRNFSTYEY